MRLQSTRCKPLWSIPTRFASRKTLYSNASQPFDTLLRCCYRTSTTIQLKCKPFSICIFEPIFSYDEMCIFMCCTPSLCASTPVPSVHCGRVCTPTQSCSYHIVVLFVDSAKRAAVASKDCMCEVRCALERGAFLLFLSRNRSVIVLGTQVYLAHLFTALAFRDFTRKVFCASAR
jgi:hypothetical protein